MSRIGKLPIKITDNVQVKVEKTTVTVTGPKGSLSQFVDPKINIKVENGIIFVENKGAKSANALHGLYRSLINNMVIGVTSGWSKTLELTGVGYKAQVNGRELVLALGFSHPVKFTSPEGITFTVMEKEGRIVISGTDKQLVGEIAATIRKVRPPEPYKGKGIHYLGEKIKRKAGKSAKAVGTAGAK